jgi:lipoprotein-anchoring transpeptidase ErfK/SrfK
LGNPTREYLLKVLTFSRGRIPPFMKSHLILPDSCASLILCVSVLLLANPHGLIASGSKGRETGERILIPVNERQGSAVIYEKVISQSTAKSPEIMISLSKQRFCLMLGGELAIDSPIASGRKEGWTPKGSFTVLENDLNHQSNRYGDLVDCEGRVIRKNVICGATGGTFRGATMKYFLRLTWEGVGMHAGILPGYPASHGCIRLPKDVAERLFKIVPTGTPVSVTD